MLNVHHDLGANGGQCLSWNCSHSASSAYRWWHRPWTMDATVICLCGQVKQTLTLAAEAFPIETPLCHCDSCRSASGVLVNAYLDLARPPESLANLTSYDSMRKSIRYFCGKCGTHVVACDKSREVWWVASGTIEHEGDVVRIMHHEYVEDTKDGGLATCLIVIADRSLSAYATMPDQRATYPLDAGSQPLSGRDEKLHARCHCGGVQYYVTPPNEMSTNLSSPWPDLLVPSHSGHSENQDDVKWWMRAGGTKFLAGTCACRSCRLASGFPIQAWAFIPKANIMISASKPLDFSMGTLRQYESSPGVFREFCSVCGASAFWHCEARPHLIDVSLGLLKSPCGARAEDWLDWETRRVSFREDALDQELVMALEAGLQVIKSEH